MIEIIDNILWGICIGVAIGLLFGIVTILSQINAKLYTLINEIKKKDRGY